MCALKDSVSLWSNNLVERSRGSKRGDNIQNIDISTVQRPNADKRVETDARHRRAFQLNIQVYLTAFDFRLREAAMRPWRIGSVDWLPSVLVP